MMSFGNSPSASKLSNESFARFEPSSSACAVRRRMADKKLYPHQTELSFRPAARGVPPNAAVPVQPEPVQNETRVAAKVARVVHSVGDIVRAANRVVDGQFGQVCVEGEVFGLKTGAAGHVFFTLKDDAAILPTAMWRTAVERLRFRLEDGQMLRVEGRLGIFPKQGKFQFYAERAEPSGLGALMLELEQIRQRLAADGLLDPKRKRSIPRWPQWVGVVTSSHGAVIHDIVEVARRRCPTRILLAPAVVQGPEAPASLRRALRRLSARPEIDVIIIGRGGGSTEDLWAFNDEKLARDVAACRVPVVSAVGHEVDITICDLVADLRVATPSQAAEVVVPDLRGEQQMQRELLARLVRAFERQVIDHRGALARRDADLARLGRTLASPRRHALHELDRALRHAHPRQRIARDRRRFEALVQKLLRRGQAIPLSTRAGFEDLHSRLLRMGNELGRAPRTRLERLTTRLRQGGAALTPPFRLRLAAAAASLHALSPLAVLHRGFAVVANVEGKALTDVRAVKAGDEVSVRLLRGRLRAQVTSTDDLPVSPAEEGDKGRDVIP